MNYRFQLSWYYILLYDWIYSQYVRLWRRYKKFCTKTKNVQDLIYDEFGVAPIKELIKSENSSLSEVFICFKTVKFGLTVGNVESVDSWIHELCELALLKLRPNGFDLGQRVVLSDRWNNIRTKATSISHIITAQHTRSRIVCENITSFVDGDGWFEEFKNVFNVYPKESFKCSFRRFHEYPISKCYGNIYCEPCGKYKF